MAEGGREGMGQEKGQNDPLRAPGGSTRERQP